jgi:predicted signal transduction protein with EAL and GGDEF domain
LQQPADAAILAKRVREAIAMPYELHGQQVLIDTSIGIAVAPNDGREPDQLLKNADMALYGAKTAGRGTYRFFEPEMDARVKARRIMESDIRNALVAGEFESYYQPIINLGTNKISGVEALLRWRHPQQGIILPGEFISIAEEIGLITSIGEWILRKACLDVASWPNDINVAVNLSPVQLRTSNLVQVVVNALAASGLPANRLELEITEAVLIQDTETTIAALHQLRALGVRIAMDDFGTGYSSLNYLRRFPFDKIKIDRCFISGLSKGKDSFAIVKSVTDLAKNLHMTTTAEGVETEQQLETIRHLGCAEAQGYLFSSPRPAEDIVRLLLRWDERARAGAVAA